MDPLWVVVGDILSFSGCRSGVSLDPFVNDIAHGLGLPVSDPVHERAVKFEALAALRS